MSEGTQNGSVEGLAADERTPPQARLRRLTIHRFRNVRPTTLTFDDEWNVLLGKNGTGKTTLLELIAATLRGDLKALIELDPDVELQAELSFGIANVTWVIERRQPSSVLSASSDSQARHSLTKEEPGRRFTVRVSGEGIRGYEKKGTEKGFDSHPGLVFRNRSEADAPLALALFLEDDGGIRRVERSADLNFSVSFELALRSANVIRFDELLTVFQRIGPNGGFTITKRYDGNRVFSCKGAFCSDELAEAVYSAEPSDGERVTFLHKELTFLQRFVELCGFESGWLHLTTLENKKIAGKLTAELGRPSFLFRRHNHELLREEHLSFGQKRLLSFLYYTTLADPIVADELVDGLHYDWIEACVSEVRGRQKFFASQNPLLVDHMGFKTRESVRSRFLRCTAEGDELVWSNLSAAEADDFFVAYRTGISAVSDVLRRQGLW